MNGAVDYSALDKENTIKPDNPAKATVVFKPGKRMKKRRQLDALVSNGKLPRRKTSSGHELLRSNDSESSEVEEFSVLEGQKWGRRFPSSLCCTTFYLVIMIVIMTACVLACATLIWMHLELKRDFNNLRTRLALVENKNAGTLEEFEALQSRLQAVNRSVVEKTSGLDMLNKSISEIKRQISSLESRTTQLQQNLPAQGTSDVQNKAVANTVASLGSDLQSTRTDVDDLKSFKTAATSQLDNLSARVAAIEKPGGREGNVDPVAVALQAQLMQMNTSFVEKIDKALTGNTDLQTQMNVLNKYSTDLKVQLDNVTSQVVNVNQSHLALESIVAQNSKLLSSGTKEYGNAASTSGSPDTDHVTDLESKLQMLQKEISQIQSDHSSMNSSQVGPVTAPGVLSDAEISSLKQEHEEFLTFKVDVMKDVQMLNGSLTSLEETVGSLKTNVGILFTQMSDTMQQTSNVTTVIEGLVHYMESQKEQTKPLAGTLRDAAGTDNDAPNFPSAPEGQNTGTSISTRAPSEKAPLEDTVPGA